MRMLSITSNMNETCSKNNTFFPNDLLFFLYRKLGIFPQALNNYITTNGGGFSWGTSLSKSHSMNDLIEAVTILFFLQISANVEYIFHFPV